MTRVGSSGGLPSAALLLSQAAGRLSIEEEATNARKRTSPNPFVRNPTASELAEEPADRAGAPAGRRSGTKSDGSMPKRVNIAGAVRQGSRENPGGGGSVRMRGSALSSGDPTPSGTPASVRKQRQPPQHERAVSTASGW